MKRKTIAIGLLADRIDVLLLSGGHVVASRRIPAALENDPERWGKSVRNASKAVQTASEQLGAAGANAIVLYRSPSECADYTSLNVRSIGEAENAAILACADSLACPLEHAVCRALVVGRDAPGAKRHSHVVVAADSDQTVESIFGMVDDAGLMFEYAVPLDAAITARFTAQAFSSSAACAGQLYVGEHRSVFIVAGERSLLFARPIGLGINTMVTCLTRPIRTARNAEPVELPVETARRILHEHGYPDRKHVVHDELGLVGGHIVPLLQPVLQRFMVELRQSLRFSVPDDKRSSLPMTISGPGALIPGFVPLIAAELNLQVTCDPKASDAGSEQHEAGSSELTDALENPRWLPRLGLVPRHVSRRRHMNRMQRWLWAGGIAALAMIGVENAATRVQLVDARKTASAIASRSAEDQVRAEAVGKILVATEAMRALEARIVVETGARLDLAACMHELSRLTPPTIRLISINVHKDQGRTVGVLSGYALDDQAAAGRTRLEPFIEQLRGSPLFEKVMLANVYAGSVGESEGQKFEASFVAVSAPRLPPAGVIANAEKGDAP